MFSASKRMINHDPDQLFMTHDMFIHSSIWWISPSRPCPGWCNLPSGELFASHDNGQSITRLLDFQISRCDSQGGRRSDVFFKLMFRFDLVRRWRANLDLFDDHPSARQRCHPQELMGPKAPSRHAESQSNLVPDRLRPDARMGGSLY